ncbi:unnamed protein product [Ambrosiozyma monospora]|uniref:Unnamed protein product n=1 Tax=Ambrosiozyma monospora TaxID=43982 RepID=A0ACB5SV52_AMBMO|nr:unnamed protein product [Ambrosiozyma monospora]
MTLPVSATPSSSLQNSSSNPNANDQNKSGLSTKNRNIIIGVVVGLGIPILALIAAILFFLYKKKQQSKNRYVDSNGIDIGYLEFGNSIWDKLCFWRMPSSSTPSQARKRNAEDFGLFDEDEDDLVNAKQRGNGKANGGGNEKGLDGEVPGETGFVVNRAKSLRLSSHF